MKLAVIGGGPAGVLAAASAALNGQNEVVLFEKNEKLLKKLYISGKGRCNVTNACGNEEFLSNVVRGGKFLFSALKGFSPYDTMRFFEDNGLNLKVERGNRVFPVSDKSSDVIKVLTRYAEQNGVKLLFNAAVTAVRAENGGFTVVSVRGTDFFDALIIATGGLSYPLTGSTGDGYAFAKSLGHTVTALKPALCAVGVRQDIKELEGLSLKNVTARAVSGDKTVDEQFGEMLFAAGSLSGPIILSLSSRINQTDGKNIKIIIDLKPALNEEVLDARILRDFKDCINKNFSNALSGLLPKSLIPYIINSVGISPLKKINEISREERKALVYALKNLTLDVTGLAPIESAIVTGGGISLSEINPKTMESKLVKGLYFAGEVLDIDALTGGFNIQIALSTGFAAGKETDKAAFL
ncbi:MAG: NAD(P)/FAD-dependent oxidoreductase [Clostridiales bacterium]|jgi:predicted Rossmann fold flavoprotein|nr:NAD(P)/FAD-dependent oxidoreductase [Clostridiales bacterium]